MAVIVVTPGVFVKVKLPVACVCPKGIVISEVTYPTTEFDENTLTVVFESGFLAGFP